MFNIDLTKHLAELSKINFTESELNDMTADMAEIVAIMDKVRDFSCDISTDKSDAINFNDLRSDIPESSFTTHDIVKNAKTVTANSFTVPKIV